MASPHNFQSDRGSDYGIDEYSSEYGDADDYYGRVQITPTSHHRIGCYPMPAKRRRPLFE